MTKLTLLYAEDDQETRENYAFVLDDYFSEVYTAENGKEALNIYNEKKPDVLLLDINMSYISGLDLVKIIRKNDKNTPIIMLTAYSDHDMLMSAVNLKLEKYLIKPIDDLILKNTILKLVKRIENKEIIYLQKDMVWDKNNSMLLFNHQNIKLTRKEKLLIQLLCSVSGNYIGPDALIFNIWHDEVPDSSYVSKLTQLISRLNKKVILETRSSIPLVENSYSYGYRLDIILKP